MSLKTSTKPFNKRVDDGISNLFMRKMIAGAQDQLRKHKLPVTTNDIHFGHWDEWKQSGEEIRRHTIKHLDYYLTQLSDNFAKRGGHVYFAETVEKANDYIVSVINQDQSKKIVKTKSMVTEELGINKRLEAEGCDVVETDLGEYIVQLDDDYPSHIIAPALHKNLTEIQQLYKEKIGYTGSDDPEELTAFTRQKLRRKFLEADVGIIGCNFAVANSGAITLVTNEGNANMVTTLPNKLIAVMGMERIVPTWEELDILVSLLCRSAIGQRLSTYVTAIAPELERATVDAPDEFHLVILDGGRSKALDTPFQDVLHCIRCSACLNVCPIYRHVGGHAYGSIYQGPIGAVLSPILSDDESFNELPYASSLCAACTEVCPVNIPLHDLLIRHREQIALKHEKERKSERILMKSYGTLTKSSTLFNLTMSATKRSGNITSAYVQNRSNSSIGPLKNWLKHRDLPQPSTIQFRKWFKQYKTGRGEINGEE